MKTALLCAAVATALCNISYANVELDPLEVTVTGDRFQASLATLSNRVTVLSRAQISATGAQSLVEALRRSGLVQFTRSTNGNPADDEVSMGPFGENSSQNTLVLVNGQRLGFSTLEAPNLGLIALESVEQIEILEGSAGALFGEGAVGGVINILTSTPETSRSSIEVRVGENNLLTTSLFTSVRLSDEFSASANVNRKQSDNERENSRTETDSGKVTLTHSGTDSQTRLFLSGAADDQGLPGTIQNPKLDEFVSTYQQFHGVSHERNLNATAKLHLDASYQLSRNRFFTFGSENFQDTRQILASARYSDVGSLGSYNLGVDHQDSYFESSFQTTSKQDLTALFAHQNIEISDSTAINIGTRANFFSDKLSGGQNSHDHFQSWSASIIHGVNENNDISFAWDRSLRLATIDELNSASPRFLEPQENDSFRLGWSANYQTLETDVSYTRSNFKNEIAFDPSATAPGSMFSGANANLPDTKRDVLRISASTRISDNARAGFTYSHQLAEFTAGTNTGKEIPWVPKNIGNGFIFYQLSDEFSVYTNASYTGSRFVAGDEDNDQAREDGYWAVDLAFNWERDSLKATVGVNNLFDKKYNSFASESSFTGVTSYPALSRNVFASMKYSF